MRYYYVYYPNEKKYLTDIHNEFYLSAHRKNCCLIPEDLVNNKVVKNILKNIHSDYILMEEKEYLSNVELRLLPIINKIERNKDYGKQNRK